jgi:hypothetical protein
MKRDRFKDGTKIAASIPVPGFIDFEGTVIRKDDIYGPVYFIRLDRITGQNVFKEGQEIRLTRAMLGRNAKVLP